MDTCLAFGGPAAWMQGAVMDRYGTQKSASLPRVTSMADVLALLR